MSKKLTKREKEAMKKVAQGGDVFDYTTAMDLRRVQRKCPSLIAIGAPVGDYGDGSNREPYFGAVLTAAGLEALGV